MAARLNPKNVESVRQKIKVAQLIERLQNHVLGSSSMESSQVKAASYLISQSIGNPPQQLDHSGSIEISRLVILE